MTIFIQIICRFKLIVEIAFVATSRGSDCFMIADSIVWLHVFGELLTLPIPLLKVLEERFTKILG